MQDTLFGDFADNAPKPPSPPTKPRQTANTNSPRVRGVQSVPPEHLQHEKALSIQLPPTLRMGTSTWSYPGWQGLVWDGEYDARQLASKGLAAYSQHPLLRTVCIDRSFYRPLTLAECARYAAQVPDDFRFVVKAPAMITDALVRSEQGAGRGPNPAFLNPDLALREFVEPALQGFGPKLGALVFQISPLPWNLLDQLPRVMEQLHILLAALPRLTRVAPDAVVAVEVRDAQWLVPVFAQLLRDTGATYCLGLHAKLPPLAEQLPLLRALWPGPLVCRWNLNAIFGPYGYADAGNKHAPFDAIRSPDPDTRALLARTVAGVCGAGQSAYVTISNDAEGCAPRSIGLLAEAVINASL
jgi:uncharacterized protein YecE (DUF72 family)